MSRFLRFLLAGLVPVALAACSTPSPAAASSGPPPLGSDLGGSGPVARGASQGRADAPQHMREMQMAHAGHDDAHGSGTVNSVDAAQHKINISHGPIPAIGFPAMTMDFAVAPAVDLRAVTPGSRINFTIEQGQDGMYVIQSVAPAGGAK